MITAENPFYFDGMDQMVLFRSICEDTHDPPTGVSDEGADFIQSLLVKDPTMRLGSLMDGEAQVLNHKWFVGLDVHDMRKRECLAPWVPTIKNPLDSSHFDDWSELEDKTEQRHPKLKEEDALIFSDF